jgi:TolB-like protein/DNA-binding winged helix-turn-helix (wHTH) protein
MSRRFRFNDFEIDLQSFRLLQAGKALPVEPKALNLLIFLVENRRRLIERRELIDAVWGDSFVTDHVLNRAIAQLRKLLEDDRKQPRYIETVPTLGYRFIGDVEEVQELTTQSPASSRISHQSSAEPAGSSAAPAEAMPIGASGGIAPEIKRRISKFPAIFLGSVALVIAAAIAFWIQTYSKRTPTPSTSIRSLVVLPLDNLSGDASQQYVADGMTSELITDLAQIKALRVVSQTTAMQYRGAHKSLPEIAKELHVDAVIEGDVVRSKDKIQIAARLVDAPGDKQLWAGSYNGTLEDLIGLENQVAATVAERIRIELSSQERTQLAASRQVDPRASEAYFKGNAASQPNTQDAWRSALPFFEQAVGFDPRFARAYVAIARSYNFLGDRGYHVKGPWVEAGEAVTGADSAIAKALELDPESGEAYEERAWTALKFRWDFQGAEEGFRRALELKPGAPSAHDGLAHDLVSQGRFDEAVREIGLAQELDPLSLVVNSDYCRWLHLARQDDRALKQCQATLRLGPNFEYVLLLTADLYERKGDYAPGHELLTRLGCDPSCLVMQDEIHGAPGVSGAFNAWLKGQEHPPEAFFLARAYAKLHRRGEAFVWLEKAYELHSDVVNMSFLSVDPDFDSLRSDPRFDAFLKHVGLPPQPKTILKAPGN